MVGSAIERLQSGLQKSSAGIDSATQKVETGQKLVNSEFRYGVPLQTQPLLDYLGQMSAEADEKHHSLSRSGAADLVASVDVDVNDENLLIGLNPFAKPVGKSEPK